MSSEVETDRRNHLFLVTDNLLEVHKVWVESDTIYFTEEMEKAVEETVEVFARGAIPGDCRVLNERVTNLSVQWEVFKQRASITNDPICLPDNAFWKALEWVADARRETKPKARRVLETITDLEKQKVPDKQICLIYGWRQPNGSPDFAKLQEERTKPGTHTGEGFVPPLEKKRQEAEARERAIVTRLREQRERKVERATAPPPESLQELIATKVSGEQIANLFHCTLGRVREMCDEQGLPHPPDRYESLNAVRGPHEPDLPESVARAYGEYPDEEEAPSAPMTLEQEIVHYSGQGMNSREVAEAVSREDAKVSWQKVNAVLKRFKKEPEAFGVV